jgi:DNA-binding NarL/FixJ family response regulator
MFSILVVKTDMYFPLDVRSLAAAHLPDADVCEAAELGSGLDEPVATSSFDLILLDAPSRLSGVRRTYHTRPATRFALVLASCDCGKVLEGLAAGFHGVILAEQPSTTIIEAIRYILSGQIYVPPALADCPISCSADSFLRTTSKVDKFSRLSPREKKVLDLLALGLSNKEIARQLNSSPATIKAHATAILRTLGVRNRTEAALVVQKRAA